MKPTHTPTPWSITPDGDITAACVDNSIIVHGSAINAYDVRNMAFENPRQLRAKDDGGAANAAFIVRAVNSHQALIDALEQARVAFLHHAPHLKGSPLDVYLKSTLKTAKGE